MRLNLPMRPRNRSLRRGCVTPRRFAADQLSTMSKLRLRERIGRLNREAEAGATAAASLPLDSRFRRNDEESPTLLKFIK